jgi:branched-chain amino acid transport system ATP-binding protein
MSAEQLLRLESVSAGYEGTAVVHEVDLVVTRGEIVTLIGSNGAGKSTTLLTISGLVPLMSGAITLFGTTSTPRRRTPTAEVWRRARRGIAHVPEDRGLFFDLTGMENLRLGQPRKGEGVPIDQVLAWFPQLTAVLNRRAGLLSGGEQQMLAMARAMLSKPQLLLVDELSLGLAPMIVEQLLSVLRTIATETGTGILVVEQHVQLVLEVADRAALMRQGRILFDGAAAELKQRPELLESGYLGDA